MPTQHVVDRICAFARRWADSMGHESQFESGLLHEYPASKLLAAAADLRPSEAERFFPNDDLYPLLGRLLATEYISHPETPRFALSDFARAAQQFSSKQKDSEVSIIRTGMRPEYFDDCRWLCTHLGCLYPTRVSSPPYLVRLSSSSDRVPRYNWLNPSTTASTLRQDGTSVPYENARYLDNLVYNGISCPDLEQERSSLLQLKLDILTSLASDIRNGTSANSWEQCYAVLAEAVSVEHISYLLSTDAVYLHGSRHWPADASLKLDFQSSPGGIANLLIVICHITAESKYPTFTNELLALFRRDDLNLGDGFTYFSVCNTNDRLKVDRVLDAFLSAVAKQAPIWQSSERHINAKLAESPNNSATRFPLASLFLPNPLRHHIACLTRAERQTPPMPHAESDHTLIPTSHPVTADKPFNARHHEVLDVLSRKGVNSSSKALKAAQIARCMKPCCTASSLKRILKRLKTVGYIDAKEGTGGGYWITGEGVSFIESEKQRNAPTLKQRYSQ